LHYADNEAAMLDTNSLIVEHGIQLPHTLFSEAKLSKLYGKEVVWSRFNDVMNAVYTSNERSHECPLTADEVVKLDAPQVCVQLSSLGGSYEPHCFATQVTENAHVSHAAMAFGSVSKDNDACEIFEARVSKMLATVFATIQAVSAGKSKGIHLCQEMLAPMIGLLDTGRSRVSFFIVDTVFVTSAAKSTQGNICAQLFVSDRGFVTFYPIKKQQEVHLAVKQFAKEVGAPEVLVCDPHLAQIKQEVHKFCTQIGTTLKVLEAKTQ
jgi:hypothetical protein